MLNFTTTNKQLRVIRDCLTGLNIVDFINQDRLIDDFLFSQGCRELPFSMGLQWITDHFKQFLAFASDNGVKGLKTAEIKPKEETTAIVPKGFNFKGYRADPTDNYPHGFDYSKN